MPYDDSDIWQSIPTEITDSIKKASDAALWAGKKRQEVADAWAREQRRYGDALETSTRQDNPFARTQAAEPEYSTEPDYVSNVPDQQVEEQRYQRRQPEPDVVTNVPDQQEEEAYRRRSLPDQEVPIWAGALAPEGRPVQAARQQKIDELRRLTGQEVEIPDAIRAIGAEDQYLDTALFFARRLGVGANRQPQDLNAQTQQDLLSGTQAVLNAPGNAVGTGLARVASSPEGATAGNFLGGAAAGLVGASTPTEEYNASQYRQRIDQPTRQDVVTEQRALGYVPASQKVMDRYVGKMSFEDVVNDIASGGLSQEDVNSLLLDMGVTFAADPTNLVTGPVDALMGLASIPSVIQLAQQLKVQPQHVALALPVLFMMARAGGGKRLTKAEKAIAAEFTANAAKAGITLDQRAIRDVVLSYRQSAPTPEMRLADQQRLVQEAAKGTPAFNAQAQRMVETSKLAGNEITLDEAKELLRQQTASNKQPVNLTPEELPDIPDWGRERFGRETETLPSKEKARRRADQQQLGERLTQSQLAAPEQLKRMRNLLKSENLDWLESKIGKTTRQREYALANALGDVTDDELADIVRKPTNPEEAAVRQVRLIEKVIPYANTRVDDALEAWQDAVKAQKDEGIPKDVVDLAYDDYVQARRDLAALQVEGIVRGTMAGTALQAQKNFRPVYLNYKTPGGAQDRIIRALKAQLKPGEKLTEEAISAKMDEWLKMTQDTPDPRKQAQWWLRLEAGSPTVYDVLGLYNRASLMSAPSTPITNILGTALTTTYRTAQAFGSDLAKGEGRVALAEAQGAAQGLVEGMQDAYEIMRYGMSMREAERYLREGPKGQKVTTPEGESFQTGPARAMMSSRMEKGAKRTGVVGMELLSDRPAAAGDAILFSSVYKAELNRRIAKQIAQEGLNPRSPEYRARWAELKDKPPEVAQLRAREAALDATYQGDLGTGLYGKIGQGRGTAAGQIISAVLMPFYKTPVNIWKQGIELTPGLGLAQIGWDALQQKRTGIKGPVTRSFKARLGDQVVGAAVTAYFYNLAMNGGMSAAGPQDPDKRRMLEAQGWQPYSIKIGDQWVQYSNWGPLAIPMAASAGLAEAVQYKKPDATTANVFMDSAQRFGSLVKTQSYIQGIGQILDAVDSGAQAQNAATVWGAGMPQRLIPAGSLVNAVARSGDVYERTPDIKSGDYVGQRLAVRLPGLRETAPIKQDVLGNRVPNVSPGVESFLPIRSREAKQHPVISEYQRYQVDIGLPADSVKGVPLTRDEQLMYQRIMGRQLEEHATDLMATGKYQAMTPEKKQAALKKIMTDARGVAADDMVRRIGKDEFKRRLDEEKRKQSSQFLAGVR